MPATSVERRQKFIDKIKLNGKYDDFKKKRAELERIRRQRLKYSLAKLPESKRKKLVAEDRLKSRERVIKCREKKREALLHADTARDIKLSNPISGAHIEPEPQKRSSCTSVKFENSYRTEGALLKAVSKARKMIPSSPSKEKAIVAKLLYSLDDEAQKEIIQNKTTLNKGGAKGIDPTLKQRILEFYENNDVSRMSPNVKDTKYVRNPTNGEKQLTQTRHMIVTLQEAYNAFEKDNAGAVKLSKFSSLRPAYVKLVKDMPLNVCVCMIHSNFIECCNVLHANLPKFPAYGRELMKLLVCDESNRDCCFKTCVKCHSTIIEQKLRNIAKEFKDTKKVLKWKLWEKNVEEKRTQREIKTGSVINLMDYVISIHQEFLIHSFTNHEQSEYFKYDCKISENNPNECVINIDFAENYTTEAQDEVSPAHWNQKQITVFTAVLRYMGKVYPTVKVSDNTDHSKNTIVSYLYKLFLKLPKTVKTVKLWSDGPNSQFKNKFMAAVIKVFEKLFSFKLIWNYFATAHGKGSHDGVGAVAKSKIKRIVASRGAIVNSAKDFAEAFNTKPSSIDLSEMTIEEINKINADLRLCVVFNTAPPIKNIFKSHQLQTINDKVTGFPISKDGYASLENV